MKINEATKAVVRPNQLAQQAEALQVQSAVEVKHANHLRKLGMEVVAMTGAVAGKYVEICQYIRVNKLAPKLVSHELMQLGFNKVRVSEINRVANASDKLWKEYEAKQMGFDRVLALARVEIKGEAPVLTPAGQQLLGSGAVTEKETNEALRDAAQQAQGRQTGKNKKKLDSVKRKAWAQQILETLHPKLQFPLLFTHGAYTLTVTFDASKVEPSK